MLTPNFEQENSVCIWGVSKVNNRFNPNLWEFIVFIEWLGLEKLVRIKLNQYTISYLFQYGNCWKLVSIELIQTTKSNHPHQTFLATSSKIYICIMFSLILFMYLFCNYNCLCWKEHILCKLCIWIKCNKGNVC